MVRLPKALKPEVVWRPGRVVRPHQRLRSKESRNSPFGLASGDPKPRFASSGAQEPARGPPRA